MLWKSNGVLMKTPSSYKDTIEDLDNDSYRSKKTGKLIDTPVAVGMLKCEMSWDYLTEEESEKLLQETYKNPMIVTIKCPSVPGGMIKNAKFRCSSRSSEMHETEQNEDTSKSKWKVSFNLVQKELTEEQILAVKEVNS